jgi:hypothetical protein
VSEAKVTERIKLIPYWVLAILTALARDVVSVFPKPWLRRTITLGAEVRSERAKFWAAKIIAAERLPPPIGE